MKGKLTILDRSGDTVLEWDTMAADAVAEAERIFAEKRRQGFFAYTFPQGKQKPGLLVRDFDPSAETVLHPPLVGG